jgi:DNA-binding response OmpR family regulator
VKKQKNWIGQRTAGIAEQSATGVKRKIIVIDDDPGVRDIFEIIFEKEGYCIELKSDGHFLTSDKSYQLPDLFFIDKQLSGGNGLDLCRYLKSHPKTSQIPVIMISASPDIASLSKEARADDYLEKPFELAHLLELADYYLRKRQEALPRPANR